MHEIFNNLKSTIQQRSFLNLLSRPKKNSVDALIQNGLRQLEGNVDAKQHILLKECLWEILKALEFKFPGFSEFFVHWQKGEIALSEKNWTELSQQFKTASLSLPRLLGHLIPFLESRYQLGINGDKAEELFEMAQASFDTGSWVEAKKQYSILLNIYDPAFGLSNDFLQSQHAFCDRALQFNFLYERTREQLEAEFWTLAHANLLKLIEWSSDRLSPSVLELNQMLETCETNAPHLSSENMSDIPQESPVEKKQELVVYSPPVLEEPEIEEEVIPERLPEIVEVPAESAPSPKPIKVRNYAAVNRGVGIGLLILAILGLSYLFLNIEKETPVYEVKQSKRLDLEEIPIESPIDQEVDFVRTGSLEEDLADK
ncbi:MAG: hypothetical protein AAGD28_20685 [Bacteroidota bacterium]